VAEVFDAEAANPVAVLAFDGGLVPLIGRSSITR
jgi:hypothetical protein